MMHLDTPNCGHLLTLIRSTHLPSRSRAKPLTLTPGYARSNIPCAIPYGAIYNKRKTWSCRDVGHPGGMSRLSDVSFDEIWSPLKTQGSIRVLELVDGASDSILECRLHHTTLESPEYPYKAISYAWGTSLHSQWLEIRCNGHRTFITPNLHSALTRVKKKYHGSFFWVDALCINQSREEDALKERASQVEMMDKIFGSAAQVIVDLGDIESDDIHMLERLSASFPMIIDADWAQLLSSVPVDHSDSGYQHLDLPLFKEREFWARFIAFVSRPYFTRIWVVQEIVLARFVVLMIGSNFREVTFLTTSVQRALNYFWRLWMYFESTQGEWIPDSLLRPGTINNVALAMQAVNGLVHLGAIRYRPQKIFDFASLLAVTRNLEASDIRDKAFALRGMSNDKDIQHLHVDYRETGSDCARRVSRYLISQGKGPWLLYNCCGVASSGQSWDYNFHSPFKAGQYDELSGHMTPSKPAETTFKACGESLSSLNIDGDRLHVSGFLLGFVRDLSSPMPYFIEHESDTKEASALMRAWWLEVETWISTHHSTVGGDVSINEFRKQCWGVVLTDRQFQGKEKIRTRDAPVSFFSSRDAFMELIEYSTNHNSTSSVECGQKFFRSLDFFRSSLLGSRKCLAVARCETNSKYNLCLLPPQAKSGDRLAIFEGCIIPFCLRRESDVEEYRIVGPCYIDDMMDGQVLTSGDYKLQEIVLR